MNRRQQKKQFKKKYGKNPKEVGKLIGDALNAVIRIVKEMPKYLSHENMTEEQFQKLLHEDGVTDQVRIYMILCRQQSCVNDILNQEKEKFPKQTEVNRSN